MYVRRIGPTAVALLTLPSSLAAAEDFKDVKTRIRIEACRAAVAAAHPGRLVKLEYKWRDRSLVYEFEVAGTDGVRWEVECDGYQGRVIQTEREVASPDDPQFAARRKVGLDEARRIALQRFPGEVVETEYEIEENGNATYEFDLRTRDGREMKLEVDAATGQIIEDGQEEFRQYGHD